MQLRLVIHSKKSIYDDLIVSDLRVTQYVKNHVNNNTCNNTAYDEPMKPSVYAPSYLNNRKIDSYAVSAYIDTLMRSSYYRQCSTRPLLHCKRLRESYKEFPVILIKLRIPKKQFLDYKWGEKMSRMALERREIDHSMSWLSTLGGAFSALGEHFQHCAQMAGKISIHQFTLALRLGDPLLVARCKLYAALSIIQQGNLRMPKLMIRDIFEYAIQQKDIHLQKMCQGVWAKLKYCYKQRRQQKKQLNDLSIFAGN